MLQRTLQRTLQRQWPSIHHSGHVCTCQCGRLLPNTNSDHQQRRSATRRASPTAWGREHKLKRRALSPEEVRKSKELTGEKHNVYYEGLWLLYRAEFLSVVPDVVIDFLNDFDALLKQAKGRPTVEPEAFNEILEKHGIPLEDVRTLSRDLLVNWGFMQDRQFLGKKLLLSVSRAGSEEATISVMGHALLQHVKRPGPLKSTEVRYAREHLDEMVKSGQNYRAEVLEGRIAEALGDQTSAIKMWTNAMASAVEAAAEEERLRKAGVNITQSPSLTRSDQFELTSPWIDLFHIHRKRGEARQANWALEIGCQQDDPDAHYLYADYSCLLYHDYERTEPMYTSDWLYHMTKAAASGHKKAAYELGEFYAQSSWKYIEDEPPDHMKPTPFDSYPAPMLASVGSSTRHVMAFLGVMPVERPKNDNIFQSAAFPHTATDRFRMAFEWINIAYLYAYAPASLLRAKIRMQKTIDGLKSSPRDAPRAALELTDDRYTYASKSDYEAGIRKEPTHVEEEDKIVEGPPNPFYDLDAAKENIRDIFYAHQAHHMVVRRKALYAKKRRQGLVNAMDEDELVSEDNFKNLPMHIRKWFRHQEVREQYEDKIEDLLAEAKDICDAEGWDLYDDDGGLVYRARKASGRG